MFCFGGIVRFKPSSFGYPQYELHKCADGYYLLGPTGNIATFDEIEVWAEKLLDFASEFEDDIIAHNLENDIKIQQRYEEA